MTAATCRKSKVKKQQAGKLHILNGVKKGKRFVEVNTHA
jgi:hypothetical protein